MADDPKKPLADGTGDDPIEDEETWQTARDELKASIQAMKDEIASLQNLLKEASRSNDSEPATSLTKTIETIRSEITTAKETLSALQNQMKTLTEQKPPVEPPAVKKTESADPTDPPVEPRKPPVPRKTASGLDFL